MPKLPKSQDFVKTLLKVGFEISRQNGSHVILKKYQVTVVVPVHRGKEIRIGLFKKLLKDISMNEEDFWNI